MIPDGLHGGAGPDIVIGTAKIDTDASHFDIQLTSLGFVWADEQGFVFEDVFFSYMLAKAIDDVVFLRTRTHLPVDLFDALSGEQYLRQQKKGYMNIQMNGQYIE